MRAKPRPDPARNSATATPGAAATSMLSALCTRQPAARRLSSIMRRAACSGRSGCMGVTMIG